MPKVADDTHQAMKSSRSAGQWMLRSTILALMDVGGRRSIAGNVGLGATFHFTLALDRNGDSP
jgi:hypothetical protein